MSSGCGCKEILYIDFLILLIPTPLFFAAASLLFVHFFKCFRSSYSTFL